MASGLPPLIGSSWADGQGMPTLLGELLAAGFRRRTGRWCGCSRRRCPRSGRSNRSKGSNGRGSDGRNGRGRRRRDGWRRLQPVGNSVWRNARGGLARVIGLAVRAPIIIRRCKPRRERRDGFVRLRHGHRRGSSCRRRMDRVGGLARRGLPRVIGFAIRAPVVIIGRQSRRQRRNHFARLNCRLGAWHDDRLGRTAPCHWWRHHPGWLSLGGLFRVIGFAFLAPIVVVRRKPCRQRCSCVGGRLGSGILEPIKRLMHRLAVKRGAACNLRFLRTDVRDHSRDGHPGHRRRHQPRHCGHEALGPFGFI